MPTTNLFRTLLNVIHLLYRTFINFLNFLNFLFVEQENPELSVGLSEQVYIEHALNYVFLKHALATLNL